MEGACTSGGLRKIRNFRPVYLAAKAWRYVHSFRHSETQSDKIRQGNTFVRGVFLQGQCGQICYLSHESGRRAPTNFGPLTYVRMLWQTATNFSWLTNQMRCLARPPPWPKIVCDTKRMLTCDLFEVANLHVLLCITSKNRLSHSARISKPRQTKSTDESAC